jgi:outer-membrane receptor for ferric coprogen and ferric-rhodotorulic acid
MGRTARVKAGLNFKGVSGRDRLLPLLIASTMLGGINISAPVVAHAQQRPSVQAVNFDIPAQPLASAINQFIRSTGWEVGFNSPTVVGKQSSAVKGSMPPAQALRALLAGTSLNAQISGSSTAALIASVDAGGTSSGDGSTVLETITVQGKGATTEGTGSYTSGEASTSNRLGLSLRETPQSATVVTRQRIDDQSMTSLEDVLDNTTGLYLLRGGGERPTIYARGGFTVSTLMFDGVPQSWSGDYAASPDLAMYDHVEVVRGANGLMQGAGQPSAGINFVRKMPTTERHLILRNSIGSWNNYRTELDASGALNSTGTLRGRIVGTFNDRDSFRDIQNNKHGLLYGVLEADLGENTTVTVGASHKNEDNKSPWAGIPVTTQGSHLNLPRSTFYGNVWDYWDKETTTVFARIEHDLSDGWKLKASAEKTWSDMNYASSYIQNYGSYNVDAGEYWGTYDTASYDLNVSGPITLFNRQHDLVFGVSRRDMETTLKGGEGIIDTNIDIYNWNPYKYAKPDFGIMYSSGSKTKQTGAYVTGRFNIIDPLNVIVGIRSDWYDYRSLTSSTAYGIDANITKYFGVTYDINPSHSVYASYTDIFEAQNYSGFDGNLIDPILGENYEIGVKGEYFGGALNTSLSLFLIDQTNRATLASDQTGCPIARCYEASGLVRSKGIEFEVNGEITPNWRLGLGYTYTDARYRKDATREGQLFDTDNPRHMLRFATTYEFDNQLDGLRLGASVNWRSGAYNQGVYNGAAWRIERGSDYVVNLMAAYRISERADLQLNVNNVFDRKYYNTIATTPMYGAIDVYGDPRNFKLTLTSKF